MDKNIIIELPFGEIHLSEDDLIKYGKTKNDLFMMTEEELNDLIKTIVKDLKRSGKND